MNKMRMVSPPKEIEQEMDRLFENYEKSGMLISIDEYAEKNASKRLKAYMEEMAGMSDEGDG